MDLFTTFDLSLLILLFLLFVYVFVTVTITSLHKVYFMFHFLMMAWPFCQFATDIIHNPKQQLVLVLLSFVALSLLGGGWLLLTLFLTGYSNRLERKGLFLIFLPSVISALGVIVNPFHSFVKPLHNEYVDRTYGVWFWCMIVILLSYFFVSLLFIGKSLRSPHTTPAVKKQLKLTLCGIVVLAAFSLLDLLLNVVLNRWLPIIPGLTSAGLLFSDLFFVFAVIRYKVLDLVTIAHKDVIDTIPYGILVLDENDTIIELNPAIKSYVDLDVYDQFDMSLFIKSVRPLGDKDLFISSYARRQEAGSQIEIVMEDRHPRHFLLNWAPIVYNGHSQIGRTITFQEVTKLRELVNEMDHKNNVLRERNLSLVTVQDQLYKANQELREMANTDDLTRCFNRRYLTTRLTTDIATIHNKVPFSLILFDIDFFKKINDRYGHIVGDEVLCRTVRAVEDTIRSADCLARFGGEEFMIYLPNTDKDRALELAEQVMVTVNSNDIQIDHDVTPISITISLGVLTIEAPGPTETGIPEDYLIEILSALDQSLYQAKKKGRNRIEVGHLEGLSAKNT